MTREQIITNLMACLAGISPAAGFTSQVRELRRGIHLAEELNDLPGLCLFNQRIQARDFALAVSERSLVMHLWGVVRAAHGDYQALDALAADCVRALQGEAFNPHWQSTHLGNLEVYEGGASDPLGIFDLEFTVSYEAGLTEL